MRHVVASLCDIDVDSKFQNVSAFENRGAANVTFRNDRIGNVTDEKRALVSGADFTFDNVVFHDVLVTHEIVHNERVCAIRLRPGSPAIKAADPADAAAIDRDGKPRDAAPDAGAYEYGVGGVGAAPAKPLSSVKSRITVCSARLVHKSAADRCASACPSSTKLRIKLSARPGRCADRAAE